MFNDTRVVYKYPIAAGGVTRIKGWFSRVLAVGEQDGELVLWAENSLTRTDFHTGEKVLKSEDEKIEIEVLVIGTGWNYIENTAGIYIGTVQMSDGLVWHVFVKPW